MILCRTVVINFIYLEIFTHTTCKLYSIFQLVAAARRQVAGGKILGGGVVGAASGSTIQSDTAPIIPSCLQDDGRISIVYFSSIRLPNHFCARQYSQDRQRQMLLLVSSHTRMSLINVPSSRRSLTDIVISMLTFRVHSHCTRRHARRCLHD
jgi:hypothetical protein